MKVFNVGILISGGGSNMEAILRFFAKKRHPNLNIRVVVSDQERASGLKKALRYGVESVYLPPGCYKTKLVDEAEENYIRFLKARKVNLICLAGFMRIVKGKFINAFLNQIINIHPSLLPKYKGLNTHERAIRNGEKETGCSVHLVDEGIDTGRILAQKKTSIAKFETPTSLNKKVIQLEHVLYSEVIEGIATGNINLKALNHNSVNKANFDKANFVVER